MVAPVMADNSPTAVQASVTVNEYISSTISGSIAFGALNPGETDQPASGQPAVTVTVNAETNVNCNVNIKGDADFSGLTPPNKIDIGNAKWSKTSSPGTPMTPDYALIDTFLTPGSLKTIDVYHWITVNNGQPADTYNTTFTYEVVKQ